jgi:D-aminopeptidase
MTQSKQRIRDFGVVPGELPVGEANALSDVRGVRVGHRTIHQRYQSDDHPIRTGVSIIDPAARDTFKQPVTAAKHVINGYGKTVGLPQVAELGEIETSIGLTNTLDTWTVADAIAAKVISDHPDATSVNPVVGECNDGVLNDIRGQHVTADHVADAFDALDETGVTEGCVGAGVGMTGFGWKSGIGTASRRVEEKTVGALVLMNTGKPEDLRIDGLHIHEFFKEDPQESRAGGSIVVIVGTDASLTSRQTKRLAKRSTLALGRTGCIAHHGSGDFALAFANGQNSPPSDADLTPFFRGVIEASEEAIYNSLIAAETTTGFGETTVEAIPVEAIERAVAERES